ncbi:prepilin-type N-terminal cleavage/methylation domain-containing protein [Lysinibacillus sp. OL1_EC]|uniref:prepilin-type N-terminal cleavage/methylation domain-containing protein n=1 Tax=unclassified Lysinibacillus TaxID=2636778 RepID=UPI00103FEC1E|nr:MULTISPECIES: prepilin-type N-terminal cleavage/methylation domain-containing protein [unclassified Lysinibacillus]MCM0623721.1 prepilin-type N-terminal cleavage/methylation domain-containing protein [Lysinibacillus sp. OL1_EC]TBV89383.1 prepilin-type N-terminal cleavage/methylation domain-containing protein [Lysinibacillus sp. OL1]WGT38659.1 prepilin-type N-terminal cleavage/methylation domain-containing protein [Lysinibacillus sp. 1 U-2021]
MLKKWKNKKLLKNEKGLTLVELLAVIVILAIIAAIAVPAIGNIINKSKDRAILAEASNILAGAKIAYIDGACKENKCNDESLKPYVDGVDLAGTVVELNTTTGWEVTYPRLKDIKLTEFQVKDNKATEKEINDRLVKAGGEKPEDNKDTKGKE